MKSKPQVVRCSRQPRHGDFRVGRVAASLSAVLLLMGAAVHEACASVEFTLLHSFDDSDGANPEASLVQGSDGSFYGVAGGGAAHNDGSIFKIASDGTFTTLHTFRGSDGSEPLANLVPGPDGSFYGSTRAGGANGYGTVFKITPNGRFHSLHSFAGTDGANPTTSLAQGANGYFYGETYAGGKYGDGTIFRISSAGTLVTLYSFNGSDGLHPDSGLLKGSGGQFFGTTELGGATNDGTLFRITPEGQLTTLHSFGGTDGKNPTGTLVQGVQGTLYGVTYSGGDGSRCYEGCGTVFKFSPQGQLTTLHSFDESDGEVPTGGLIRGTDGNFYGTTQSGGPYGNDVNGTVFQMTPAGVLTTLYAFQSFDGQAPVATVVEGADGGLYGVTAAGGTYVYYGTVFELAGVISVPAIPEKPAATARAR